MHVERSEVIDMLHRSHLFQGLKEDQLEKVADRVEAFLFAEKQVIFEQQGESEGFYFVQSGRVLLTRLKDGIEDTAILEAPNYFGEEALAGEPPARQVTAQAMTPVIVLRITNEAVEQLVRDFPVLEDNFRMIHNSYMLAMNLRMEWRAPREIIHYISRRHPVFLLVKLILPLLIGSVSVGLFTYLAVVIYPGAGLAVVLLILSIIGMLGWLLWAVVDWANDYAVVTNRRVVLLQKVLLLYDSRQEAPIDAVLADDLKSSQIGRILGYGNIIVRTYTGEIILDRLQNPQKVIQLINEIRDRAKVSHKKEAREEIQRTIRRRIGYEEPPNPSGEMPEVVPTVKPGAAQRFLTDLLLLRVEKDGNIIYRTHWFILLLKTGIPLLLFFALAAFTILILFGVIPLAPVIGLVILLALGPLVLVWLLYQYVDWRNDRYIITKDMIVDIYKKPLGTEEKKSAPIKNILSIDYERKNLIGLLLNFGTVYIRIGDSTFTFDNVLNPAEVQGELFQRFMEFKAREDQRQEQTQRDIMAEWIEQYHQVVQRGRAPQNPPSNPSNSG